MPTQCPTPGAIRAGACASAGRRGLPQQPGRPRRRGPAPPPPSACGRTPRRTRTWSPARGSRPQGRRAGPWSDRRGRDRPRPPPPALMSPRPLPGEGAVGQAWPLSPPRGEGPTAPPAASGPVPCRPPAHGRGHRRAGGMGRAPPPSSGVSSLDPVVPLPPAPRSPVSSGSAGPGAPRCAPSRSPCLTRSAAGLPSCAPLPSRSPARPLKSGTRLFPPCPFDAAARAPSFPPAPSPRAEPSAPAHPPLPPASRGPAEFPASASPVACRLHLPKPCPDTTLAAPTLTGRAYPGETLPRPPASPPCPALLSPFPRGPEVSPPLPPFDVEARLDAALPAPGLCCHRICLRAWGAAGRGLCMPTSCSARAWATR